MQQLIGKTALVTGASKGIGRAVALELASLGAALLVSGRETAMLEEVCLEVRERGGEATALPADLGTADGPAKLAAEVSKHSACLDILVHNAGVGDFGPLEDLGIEEWDRNMNLNARAIFLLTKALEGSLRKSPAPLLIGILSDASLRYFHAGSAYSASKAAAHALLATLRKEWQGSGIRVTGIYPGVVATAFDGKGPDEAYKADWLKPEDLASAVAYICSQAAHVLVDELVIHPVSQKY